MEERMRKSLKELGHDTDSEGLKETPFRVIKHFKEAFKCITKGYRGKKNTIWI